MGIKEFLIGWIFKNIKVKNEDLINLIDYCDSDKDGFINVGEFVNVLKSLVVKR